MAQPLPNKGPYAPEHEDLPDPGEGMVLSAYPWDQKYMEDPAWYDSLGRSLVEQRKVLTVPRSGEEQVEMVKQALEDAEASAREMDADGGIDMEDEEIKERQDKRLWGVALEAAMKGSAAVMGFLVREKGLTAKTAPDRIEGMLVELHISCSKGFIDVVKVVVEEAEADVNCEDNSETPLSRAAMGGHVELVKYLLDAGASYSLSEGAQKSIFGSAAASGSVEVMKMLLATAREKEPQRPASDFLQGYILGSAAMSASVEMLKLVIEARGYGKANDNTDQQRRDAVVAIPMCIRNDETNMTSLDTLIDCAIPRDASGAFVERDDEYLIDNISAAISNSCVRAKPNDLRKLLQLMLNATTMTRDSNRFKRVLDEAIHRCYDPKTEACAEELLENWGADPNTNDMYDRRDPYPLPLAPAAVSRGNVEWVRFWLDHGADIHRAHGPYCNGPTALALAVTSRKWDIVGELMDHGGPVDKIEEGLVGKPELYISAYGNELNSVELTSETMEGRNVCILKFENGISEEWFNNIQYRRSDAELAQDGTGRPRKGRHT